MKKKIFRILTALIAALALLLPALPANAALATEGKCGPELYWKYENHILTIHGSGKMYDYVAKSNGGDETETPWKAHATVISRVVVDEGCERIGNYAFYNCKPLAEVVFPETSLKSLGNYSFGLCANLLSVKIPESVEVLGSFCFSLCTSLKTMDLRACSAPVPNSFCSGDKSLVNLYLSENCKSVGNYSFSECTSLKTVDLSHLECIEPLAFQKCPIESVSFGPDLKYMNANAFYGCSKLASVSFADGIDPVLVSSSFLNTTPYYNSLPDGIYTMFDGKVLMNKGTYTEAVLTVPDGVTIISDGALKSSPALSKVVIPESVTTIGDYAFRDCPKLRSVYIPPTVESIGANAFGKYTSGMDYFNYSNFKITGKGGSAAQDYAGANLLPFVCEHEFDVVYDVRDCASGGFKKKVCKWCGACTEKEPFPEGTSHAFDEKTVAATCTEEGYTLLTCKVCGHEERRGAVPPAGHVPLDEWVVVSLPDCRERGSVVRFCAICGDAAEVIPIEKRDHVPGDVYETLTPPGCTEDGTEAILCLTCGEPLVKRSVPATGHEPSDAPVIMTLPGEDGSLRKCSVTFCKKCSEIIEMEWLGDQPENAPKYAAMGALTQALTGGATHGATLDFNSDGSVNSKDFFAVKKIR